MKLRQMMFGMLAVVALASCSGKTSDSAKASQEPVVSTQPAPVTEKFKVEFMNNFGEEDNSVFSTVEVEKGAKVAKPEGKPTNPNKNMVFRGWFTTEACVTGFKFDTAVINADTKIYAGWADSTNFDKWSLVGNMTGWGDLFEAADDVKAQWKLDTVDGSVYEIKSVSLDAGTEFKVVKNYAWEGQLNINAVNKETSADALENYLGGTGNIVVAVGAKFDITVDTLAAYKLTIVAVEALPVANPVVQRDVWFVGGPNSGWAYDDETYKFHHEGEDATKGTYTLTIDLTIEDAFKIRILEYFKGDDGQLVKKTGDSDNYFGYQNLSEESTLIADSIEDMGSNKIAPKEAGTYKFTIVLTNKGPADFKIGMEKVAAVVE